MPVTPTDDEQAIRAVALDFFAARSPLAAPPDAWAPLLEEMAALDFFSQSLPEEAGGLGMSPLTSGLIAEAGARELAPGPWLDQLVAVRLLARQPDLVGPLVSGERSAAVWFGRPPEDTVAYDPASGTVRGAVRGVRFGDAVDRWVLSLPDAVVVVDPAASGVVDVVREHSVDPRWVSLRARLEEVPVLGAFARAPAEAAADLGFAAGVAAAAGVGGGRRALDDAIAYVKDREQFGRPVGSFQAIKHRAANASIALLHARSLVYAALAAADVHRLHVARVAADRAYRQAAEASLQMQGGIGFTAEANVHLFLKHAQRLRAWPRPVERDLELIRADLDVDVPLEVAA